MRHQYLLEAGSTIYLFVQLLIALCMLSHVTLFATLWTVACQAPLSIRFPRQEHWNGLPCPPPGDLTDPGIKPMCPATPALQVDSLLGKPLITFLEPT